jgi:hypothetical protein
MKNNVSLAEKMFKQVLSLDTSNTEYYLNLIQFCSITNNKKLFKTTINKFFNLDPNNDKLRELCQKISDDNMYNLNLPNKQSFH